MSFRRLSNMAVAVVFTLFTMVLFGCAGDTGDGTLVGTWETEGMRIVLSEGGTFEAEIDFDGECEVSGTWTSTGGVLAFTVEDTDCEGGPLGESDEVGYSLGKDEDGWPTLSIDDGEEGLMFYKLLFGPPSSDFEDEYAYMGHFSWLSEGIDTGPAIPSEADGPVFEDAVPIGFQVKYDGMVSAFFWESCECTATGTITDMGSTVQFNIKSTDYSECPTEMLSYLPEEGDTLVHAVEFYEYFVFALWPTEVKDGEPYLFFMENFFPCLGEM